MTAENEGNPSEGEKETPSAAAPENEAGKTSSAEQAPPPPPVSVSEAKKIPDGVQAPTCGRIVHVMLQNGATRPAAVTSVEPNGLPNLQVFHEGTRDGLTDSVLRLTAAPYDGDGSKPYTWRWPKKA